MDIKSWRAYWSTVKVAHLITSRTLTRGSLIYTFLEPTFWIASIYILYSILLEYSNISRIFPKSTDYLIFTLLGLAVFSYALNAINNLGFLFYREQTSGTLESIFATPTSLLTWIWGRITYPMLFTTINFFYVILIGFVFLGLRLPGGALIALAIAALILTVLSMYGLALILGGLCLVYKNPFVVTNILLTFLFFISGIIVPIEVLPHWCQVLAMLFPLTHGLKTVRMTIITHTLPGTLAQDFGILSINSVLFLTIGHVLFRYLRNVAKKKGVIGFY